MEEEDPDFGQDSQSSQDDDRAAAATWVRTGTSRSAVGRTREPPGCLPHPGVVRGVPSGPPPWRSSSLFLCMGRGTGATPVLRPARGAPRRPGPVGGTGLRVCVGTAGSGPRAVAALCVFGRPLPVGYRGPPSLGRPPPRQRAPAPHCGESVTAIGRWVRGDSHKETHLPSGIQARQGPLAHQRKNRNKGGRWHTRSAYRWRG